ncbi:exported hypothetical protein [metagenome]|uniref:Uncharacterized protein n=1 Tax=metagenome TaxID=256318 RepID=A0A2P2C7J2_9ZZZZ
MVLATASPYPPTTGRMLRKVVVLPWVVGGPPAASAAPRGVAVTIASRVALAASLEGSGSQPSAREPDDEPSMGLTHGRIATQSLCLDETD